MSDLPAGWAKTNLGALINRIEAGLNVKCEERPPEGDECGLVKISAVTWGRFEQDQSKTLAEDAALDERNRIRPGDLLISRANTIELVGASVIVGAIERNLYLSDKVLRLVVDEPFKRWVNYALKVPAMRKAIEDASSGNQLSMRNISQEKLRGLRIPLAPENEQQRIADKLDTVLARVDACRDRLARVAPLLKRFRQSVLAAATTGRLTEDWRANEQVGWTDAGSPTPADADIEHWASQAQPNLPNAWLRIRADEVCSKVQSGGTPKGGFTSTTGIPFLKVYNIVNQQIDFDYRPQFIDPAVHERELGKSRALPGDVLMNIVGPPLGKVAVLPDTSSEWNINQAITLFRPSDRVTSGWLFIVLCEGEAVRAVLNRTKGSVGQVNISLSQCRAFEFPVPPVAEQTEIVRRVELLFAFADRLEARLAQAQSATNRLTPALLAKAFRGELVPQDPNDEPAAELLKRLAASRAAAPQSKGRGRKA